MLDIILLYLLYAYIVLLGYYLLFTPYTQCAACTQQEQMFNHKRNHNNDDWCNKKLKIE